MIELLLTSFPVIIRYFQLRRRGETMTVWNMKTAVFIWAVLAFGLFLTIFYFHPKSYSGLVPFRTVSVVAQTRGPVTEIHVSNGQRVAEGDLLFTIENSRQTAALKQAKAQLAQLDAIETRAENEIVVAEAKLAEQSASLKKLQGDLDNAVALVERKVGTQDRVRQTEADVASAQAEVQAAEAQLELARNKIAIDLPSQKRVIEAQVESAQADLDQTEIRAFNSGVVTQMAMSVGSPASAFASNPAMVIIPDREPGAPLRITAGFSQVARSTLFIGMPAEIACDSNANMSFINTVIPAKVVGIQPAISIGQILPSSALIDPEQRTERGSLLVYFELEYPEHESIMLDGSGCIVQTYTNNLPGAMGHVIAATGAVKAILLRLKTWGALIAGVGLAGGGH